MQVTKTEQVTRTYCDVCSNDITNKNQIGAGSDTGKFDYVVCMESRFVVAEPKGGFKADINLNCEDIAKLYTKYPKLANSTFLKTFPVSDPR